MFKFVNKGGKLGEKFLKLAQNLYPYVKEQLGFDVDPVVMVISDTQNMSDPLGKTAYYEPENQCVVVFVSGRHTKDVLRSFSHELVHHNQNCEGKLNDIEASEGYAQNNNYLREMEKEAYLKGNLIFRDWEDNYKNNKGAQNMSESKFKKALDPEYDIEVIAHKRSVMREKFSERMGVKFDLSKLNESWDTDDDLDEDAGGAAYLEEEDDLDEAISGETQEDEVDNLEDGDEEPLLENKRLVTAEDISYIQERRKQVNDEKMRRFGKFGKFDLNKLKG